MDTNESYPKVFIIGEIKNLKMKNMKIFSEPYAKTLKPNNSHGIWAACTNFKYTSNDVSSTKFFDLFQEVFSITMEKKYVCIYSRSL